MSGCAIYTGSLFSRIMSAIHLVGQSADACRSNCDDISVLSHRGRTHAYPDSFLASNSDRTCHWPFREAPSQDIGFMFVAQCLRGGLELQRGEFYYPLCSTVKSSSHNFLLHLIIRAF